MFPDSAHLTFHCLRVGFIFKMLTLGLMKEIWIYFMSLYQSQWPKSLSQKWNSLGIREGWSGRFIRSPIGHSTFTSTSISTKPVPAWRSNFLYSWRTCTRNKVSAAFYHWCQCWKSYNNRFALSLPKTTLWLISDMIANIWWPKAKKSSV